MKKLLLAMMIAAPVQAATITFEDGSQVEFPDDWIVSIGIVAEQPPVECPEPPPVVVGWPNAGNRGARDPRIETPPVTNQPMPNASNRGARDPRIDSYKWD